LVAFLQGSAESSASLQLVQHTWWFVLPRMEYMPRPWKEIYWLQVVHKHIFVFLRSKGAFSMHFNTSNFKYLNPDHWFSPSSVIKVWLACPNMWERKYKLYVLYMREICLRKDTEKVSVVTTQQLVMNWEWHWYYLLWVSDVMYAYRHWADVNTSWGNVFIFRQILKILENSFNSLKWELVTLIYIIL
jgi:hypothetical protein